MLNLNNLLATWASIDNIIFLFFVGFAFIAWTCLCLRITVMILVLVARIKRIVVFYCFAVWLSWFFYTRHSRFLISHSPIQFRFRILADFRFRISHDRCFQIVMSTIIRKWKHWRLIIVNFQLQILSNIN